MKWRQLACAVALALGAAVVAAAGDEPWDGEMGSWARKDVEKILNSSPWARRVATRVDFVKDQDKQQTITANKNEQGAPRAGDVAIVWWWSARTTRRAFLRTFQLAGNEVKPEQAQQFAETVMPQYAVAVLGGGPMVQVSGQLAPEELKKAAWLEGTHLEQKVFPEDVKVVMVGGKPDRIVFYFPREVDGKPLITADSKRVLFRWRLPKKPKEPVEKAEQFEAAFEPQKMAVRGASDF